MILVMLTKGLWRHQLQPKMLEARNIPADGQIPGSFAASARGRTGAGWGKTYLFARSLSLVRPTENSASLHFRLRSRHVSGFSLRRRGRGGRPNVALLRQNNHSALPPAPSP